MFAANGERFRGLGFLEPGAELRGVEWESFAQEYPELVPDDPDAMVARLAALLRKNWV